MVGFRNIKSILNDAIIAADYTFKELDIEPMRGHYKDDAYCLVYITTYCHDQAMVHARLFLQQV